MKIARSHSITYAQAERYFHEGFVTDREWRRYQLAWCWSAPRLAGWAGALHDRVYNAFGPDAYYRRINRMRRVCGFGPLTA